MEINQLKELFKAFQFNIIYNHDLKKKNWFNIGGKAKVFFKADNLKDLVEFLKILENREKISIIGAGSNILITDDIYDGVVIKLGKNFNRISLLGEDIIISGTAVSDKSLAEYAAENNLSGFEFLACIPGTIGGGIKMNAGCFDSEIKDILISIQVIDKMYSVMGGTSVFETSCLQQHFRDVHVASQHMMVGEPIMELAGRVMLGLDDEAFGL